MSEILKAWGKIKGVTRRVVTGKISPDLSGGDEERIKKKISKCVFAKGNQIFGRSRAVELGKIYLKLSEKGREKFMNILAREFDIDVEKINELIQKFQESRNANMRIKTEMELSKALIPPYVKLLKQFNSLPKGFKFLIDFRAELLRILDKDIFLEKLDEDLKNRLYSDRMCFAFFHNKIPEFRKWFDPILLKGDESIFSPGEIKIIQALTGSQDAAQGLLDLLNSNWYENLEISKTLKPILMRLCAGYLINEKKDEKAFDPVANFHLANGAYIERLNWLGDTSRKGMKQSAGIMANYHYKLSEIEKNYELYITESRINAAPDVKKWVKKS